MRYAVCHLLLVFAVIGNGYSSCPAQSPDATTLPDEVSASADAIYGAMNEFRQLICDAAIDLDSPLHNQSLSIVARRRYTDPRFDDFIRSKLSLNPIEDDHFKDGFAAAEVLLPLSTLPQDERVLLLLDLLEQENTSFEMILQEPRGSINVMAWQGSIVPVARIAALLGLSKSALHAELKERMTSNQPKAILIAATQLIKDDAADLLPSLIQFAKSDDVRLQRVAIQTIDQLSIAVPLRHMQELTAEERNAIARISIDDKTIKYAEKIIARYDKSADGAIDAGEWKTMLIDPSPADINSDGYVTVMEYAAWMQKRSSR